MNSLGFIETFWQDLRYGLRVLRKSPGLTLVAVLSLSLGIGATTAVFSVVYGVLISPYPYAKPDQIWSPGLRDAKNPQNSDMFQHWSEYLEIQKLPSFSIAMGTQPTNQLLTGDRPPENFTAVEVTGNAFQFLGVAPVLGRTIMPSDVKPDGEAEPVIVLTFLAWQRLFSGSADALGKTLLLNDKPQTVIGAMPPRFGWWTSDGGWVPLSIDLKKDPQIATIVRLTPGVSREAARQQIHSLRVQLAREHPDYYPRGGFTTDLTNYLDMTVASGEMSSSLELLFGAVGFLLLIACANVANLQLARATARAREIALRMAVGAGRHRVVRQLLTESVVLSLVGGVLGILFAIAITKTIVALMPEFYIPNESRVSVNGYVLLFSVAVSMLTGILFGLFPALQCSRPDLVESLKDSGKGAGAGMRGGRTRNVLAVAEVALSVILLVGASLAIRGFVNLQHTDVGFQPDRVLMVGLQVSPKKYASYEQRVAFAQNILQRAQHIPGVQSAAIGNGGLPFGGPNSAYTIEGQPRKESARLLVNLISPGYTATLGIPLLAGRALSEQEVARAEHFALINEAASKLWPAGQSPVGQRIRLDLLVQHFNAPAPPATSSMPYVTVAGILANTKNAGIRNPPRPPSSFPTP